MKIIDTHTHFCDPSFDPDRNQVLAEAIEAGVVAVFTVSETMADAKKNFTLAQEFLQVLPLAGLYPTHLDLDAADAMINYIRSNREKLVGIGEVGLDFWVVKDEAELEIQQEIFTRFIQLSNELSLPLNVHSRSAGRQVINLLLKHQAKKAQLHAFDGKYSTAQPAIEAGYYFSVPPSIVRSRQKQKLVKSLPLSCLLVETDSPVLGALPDQRNEPQYILFAINAIAEIKGVLPDEIADRALENTLKLYGDKARQLI